MYGFDSAAELSEETNNPRRTAPKGITRCMVISAIGGGLLILATLMAAPDIMAPELSTQGIAMIVYLAYLFVTISPCCGTGSAVTRARARACKLYPRPASLVACRR